ncbi:MAG: hypothetical protein QXL67_00805 [Candidatus Bathyarchaeia archaeon]
MLRSVITRVTNVFRHMRALDEILEALAEEMDRTEKLQKELEKERQLRIEVEKKLTEFYKSLKSKEEEITSLQSRVIQLEGELNSVLEASLLKYLRSSGGKLPIWEYVKEYGTTHERIVETLKSLHSKGLIKMNQEIGEKLKN